MTTNAALIDRLKEEARLLGGFETKHEAVTQALLDYVQKRSSCRYWTASAPSSSIPPTTPTSSVKSLNPQPIRAWY